MKTPRKSILLVDANNLCYRSAWKFASFKNGTVVGFIQMLAQFLENNRFDMIVCAFDDKVPAFRRRLVSSYKDHRDKERNRTAESKRAYEEHCLALKKLPPILRGLGIATAVSKGYEGDDAISAMVLRRFKNHDITIYSTDGDFIQLCEEGRVRQIRPPMKKGERPSEVNACPNSWIFTKLLVGDSSDNIPGLRGVGAKKAEDILGTLGEFTGFQGMVDRANEVLTETKHAGVQHLLDNEEDLWNQYRAISLPRTARKANKAMELVLGKKDPEYVQKACAQKKPTDAKLRNFPVLVRVFARNNSGAFEGINEDA